MQLQLDIRDNVGAPLPKSSRCGLQFIIKSVERFMVCGLGAPSSHHHLFEAWEHGPKILEFKRMRTPWAALVREQEWAVILKRGREAVEHMVIKSFIPFGICEDPIEFNKGWVSTLVAPCVPSILEIYLFEVAMVQHIFELIH